MIAIRACALTAAFAAGLASTGFAQSEPLPPGRVEFSAGISRFGESSLGASDANLTSASGAPSRLFSTSTAIGGVTGFETRIGARVWRSLEAEAVASYAQPVLTTTVSNDVEASGTVTAPETITQYVIGGGAIWYLPYRTSRLAPFVSGGAAYLRELHDGDALVVTGHTWEVGGGVKYFLVSRAAGRLNAFGVRADVRAQARAGGVAFDDASHVRPVLTASAFVRF